MVHWPVRFVQQISKAKFWFWIQGAIKMGIFQFRWNFLASLICTSLKNLDWPRRSKAPLTLALNHQKNPPLQGALRYNIRMYWQKLRRKLKKKLQKVDNFAVCLSGLARVVKAPKCLFDSRKLIEITSSPLLTNICAIKGTKLSRPLDFEYLGYFWNIFLLSALCIALRLLCFDNFLEALFFRSNIPTQDFAYYSKVSYCTTS